MSNNWEKMNQQERQAALNVQGVRTSLAHDPSQYSEVEADAIGDRGNPAMPLRSANQKRLENLGLS